MSQLLVVVPSHNVAVAAVTTSQLLLSTADQSAAVCHVGRMLLASVHQVTWQFHAHEDATHEERHEDAHKGDTQQEDPVETRRRRFVRLVKHDKAKPAESEEKTRGETFHDVLAVHSVLHERHRSTVSPLICG